MPHSNQSTPDNGPDAVITGVGVGLGVDWAIDAGSALALPPDLLPSAVWLAPNVCLVRSHLSQPEDEPAVVNVVGVSNCDSLSGWVLMLG